MNDIEELLSIILSGGGRMNSDDILSAYCKKHHMIKDSHYRAAISSTLKKNPNKIKYDVLADEWFIPNMDKKNISTSKSTPIGDGLEGSPEWFYEYCQSHEDIQKQIPYMSDLREKFLYKFSVEKLKEMSGRELLNQVFADKDSMLYLLTLDDTYRQFGAGSKFPYLWPVRFFESTGECLTYPKNKAETVEPGQEEVTAEKMRDQIVSCIEIINDIGALDSIKAYEEFDKRLDDIFFSKYPWALKYYQMLYPEYFPGMYADHTLTRAIGILGLKKHGKRVVNMGEISLFIRKCNIDNISFNRIYSQRWGWDGEPGPSEYALSKGMTKKSEVPVDRREFVESILNKLIEENSNITYKSDTVKSTPVFLLGERAVDIYYRKDAVRINIKPSSVQYDIYANDLIGDIAYQKETANPESTSNEFAFFVNDVNLEMALRKLLLM